MFGSAVTGVDGYIFVGASPVSGDGVVHMFDPQDGALIRTFHTPSPEYNNGGFGRTLADFQGNLLVGAWQEPSGLNLYDIYSGVRLDAYPNTGWLGQTAAVDGTQILAGAASDSTGDRGAAYLFDGSNHTTLQTYTPPVPTIRFGEAVTFAGDLVVVSAIGHENVYEWSGAAFVFDRATGTHLHTFLDPLPSKSGYFGDCVAAAGDDILIGKSNRSKSVYLYDGSTFALKGEFQDPHGLNNGFGRSMAVMGDYLLIGSPAEDISAYNSGAAFLFDIKTGDLLHTYLDPTPIQKGGFGTSLAFFEGNVLIGEWGQSSGMPGQVHLFEMIGTISISPVNSETRRIESKKAVPRSD
jgi:WD40 repeat protein